MTRDARAADSGGRTLLDTRDLDEARDRIAQAYCPHSLTVVRNGASFHAVQREANVGAVSVHGLEYGATMLVDPVPLRNWLLVSSPVRGRLHVRSGREERRVGVGETVVLDPYRKFSLCFEDDCRLLTIRFERRLVERVLSEIAGAGDLVLAEFGLDSPVSGREAQSWSAVSTLLTKEARGEHTWADRPLLRAQLERIAVVALAETHPIRLERKAASRSRAAPATVRRVAEFIMAEPDRDFTLTDLAARAGLSVRALQEAFRRHMDTTPMGFVRQVRLRRAHQDLLIADPRDGATVAEIAFRWGFGNLGRFACDYAERYGCLPSETLRR